MAVNSHRKAPIRLLPSHTLECEVEAKGTGEEQKEGSKLLQFDESPQVAWLVLLMLLGLWCNHKQDVPMEDVHVFSPGCLSLLSLFDFSYLFPFFFPFMQDCLSLMACFSCCCFCCTASSCLWAWWRHHWTSESCCLLWQSCFCSS